MFPGMERPSRPIRLYWFPLSGHSHRAELMLSLLDLPFERVEIDILKGAQKTPEHLARNPLGQVPVIEDGDVTVPESNAILVYLATKYDPSGEWLPRDPVGAAQVQRWLSVASGPLHLGPGMARVAKLLGTKNRRGSRDGARGAALPGDAIGTWRRSASSWATRRRSRTSRCTRTRRTRPKAASRSSRIPTCAPGSRASRRCRASWE